MESNIAIYLACDARPVRESAAFLTESSSLGRQTNCGKTAEAASKKRGSTPLGSTRAFVAMSVAEQAALEAASEIPRKRPSQPVEHTPEDRPPASSDRLGVRSQTAWLSGLT
jgi:hypothetical protein